MLGDGAWPTQALLVFSPHDILYRVSQAIPRTSALATLARKCMRCLGTPCKGCHGTEHSFGLCGAVPHRGPNLSPHVRVDHSCSPNSGKPFSIHPNFLFAFRNPSPEIS